MAKAKTGASQWNTKRLSSTEDVRDFLLTTIHTSWLWRGQSTSHSAGLLPTIDRESRSSLNRAAKLSMERSSINLFRSSFARPATDSERLAATDDISTLMLLRHHSVPTRLLDWSRSSLVALFFASEKHDAKDGELWGFNWNDYKTPAESQWKKWKETTVDNSGDPNRFDAKLTAFRLKQPPNWIVAATYTLGFARNDVQQSVYTMTAQFGIDHANRLAHLLPAAQSRQKYTLAATAKAQVRRLLREEHGVWTGTMFPDAAGAANVAAGVFAQ